MKFLLMSALAWAEEHGAEQLAEAHEHAVVIPWWNITVQAMNFILFFGLLGYFLRKPAQKYFAQRAVEFRDMVERAERARSEAEKSRNEMRDRMGKLEAESTLTANQAKQEADSLRQKMIAEAQSLSQKLESEAERSATVELEKAKATLRKELLLKSLEAANESLKKNLGTTEQKRLQEEFAEKIEVVAR